MLKVESGKLPPIIVDKEVIIGYLRSPPGVVFEHSLIDLGTHEHTTFFGTFAQDLNLSVSEIHVRKW